MKKTNQRLFLCVIVALPFTALAAENLAHVSDANPFGGTFHKSGPAAEPSSFWSKMANDTNLPVECRRVFVFQLFLRHVHIGMSLEEVAKVVDAPTWFADGDINDFAAWTGWIPIDSVEGETKFAIYVLPPPDGTMGTILLRVKGTITRQELAAALKGKPTRSEALRTPVTAIAIVEDQRPGD